MTTPSRVAIVTGGSGGIGRPVVERLAADGLAVVVAYSGSEERAQEAVTAVTEAGGTATAVRGDLGDEADVARLFDEAEAAYGGVDVVVNTAGIMLLSPIASFDVDDFDRMVRTNLRGTFLVSRETVRRVRDGGALLNFSSSVVKLALPEYSAYAATKGGVDALTLVLARELRGRDVTVNTVAPGPTATPLFLDGKPQDVVDRLAAAPPLERLGTPDDVTELVAFLAGPGRWVNGQVLYVNGGIA
ncbi:SDR family oxidoreductase [Nocardioides marinquilinus]|uniref:SDR family oxidoreductase n=1 Tax=Nocardioides marinquilinus TaxID=1210400 RepID=A0ABP9P7K7_9ACTN